MVKEKSLRFASKRESGVPIARVLARRLYKNANKNGFGNAREVEKFYGLNAVEFGCTTNQNEACWYLSLRL